MATEVRCFACTECNTRYFTEYEAEKCCPRAAIHETGWETACGSLFPDQNNALVHEANCRVCKSLLPRSYGKENTG